MALQDTDILVVQQTSSGQLRKATVATLLADAGKVSSVNGKAGIVVLDAGDVGAVPLGSWADIPQLS